MRFPFATTSTVSKRVGMIAAGRLLSTRPSNNKLNCVMLNAARLDYDGRIDFGNLDGVANVTRYDMTSDPIRQVAQRTQNQTVVINKEMPLTGETIDEMHDSVKLICEAGTGYNNIDLNACQNRGIQVSNVPTYATEAMAHMAVTLVLALSCSLFRQGKALGAGNKEYLTQCHLGRQLPLLELTGKQIGLIGGLGTIGRRVAHVCQALGMTVVASSTSQPLGMRPDDGIEVVPFDDLMSKSDFVSIHCPLNNDTVGLVDAAALSKMKPTAFLVNTARGSIIDQDALVEALQQEQIAGAALDVFGEGSAPPPPLPENSPLYQLDNVILTPHIGWQRMESRQRVVDTCADNIASFMESGQGNIDMLTGRPRGR